MIGWLEFERVAPEFAAAGRRLLVGADGVAIGFLATLRPGPAPRLAPICPIFAGGGLYVSAAGRTPKVRDLRAAPAYALHAFLGQNDEEFQISGHAVRILEEDQRQVVHEAIPFAAFDRADPIFELRVGRALWAWWERPGQPDTRVVRRHWPED